MESNLQPRIKAVIGLGNPGRDYEKTRHNLGFEVVDLLAGDLRFKAGEGSFYFCRKEFGSESIVLLKPTTYMNRSGLAAATLAESQGFTPEEMLFIADDFNLPLGRIRLRQDGSDGGHNGLASIIYHLNSEAFPRIRMGIGPVPPENPAIDFVLGTFSGDEIPKAEEMIKRTADAAIMWIKEGYEIASAQFNRAID
jgi:peptidyl-tRNA hydrolase, PTH1 family